MKSIFMNEKPNNLMFIRRLSKKIFFVIREKLIQVVGRVKREEN